MAEPNPGKDPEYQPLLVFLHIPKTAGTTLRMVLELNQPGRTRRIGNVFKGGGGVKRGVTFAGLGREGRGLDEVRIVSGHTPLGVRQHLANHLPQDREVRYFTFLREPADRTLSHYFQIRAAAERDRATGRERAKLGLPSLPAEPSLDEMLAGGYVHDNLHTRMLSGLPEPFGEVTEEMLEQAKRNLSDELAFFGLTERFDESLVLARRRLGLRTILYRSLGASASSGRVNADRPRGEEIPAELREAAAACNHYDIELYSYATELFDSAPEHAEVEFQVELAALRAAKAEGEIDLEAAGPQPAGFGADDRAWRLLVGAQAELLRTEHALAEAEAHAAAQRRRDDEIVAQLERITELGKSRAGRDAETAQRVIQMFVPGRNGAKGARDEEAKEARAEQRGGASKRKRSTADRGTGGRKRGRRRRKAARDG